MITETEVGRVVGCEAYRNHDGERDMAGCEGFSQLREKHQQRKYHNNMMTGRKFQPKNHHNKTMHYATQFNFFIGFPSHDAMASIHGFTPF